ncbi:nitroreductase family protein [Saccharopolyspora mangrovi]|uniref:Nitroreductase family protein n=1 Tax=Saccharopolyspora mangrovi TaxID=3082379 RepID=A0ABU6ADH1_9PSEU|nr:nitroreductase family protein [Saccharopolyspora sp. S2-29]MEB3369591.1 nitroreductase family protein [Saccharopolyspora sp. S2-29]
MTELDKTAQGKTADTAVPLHPLLAQRWSPRALDPAATISHEQFTALFEAARWAPSWGNTQPARFIAARRGEPTFDRIHGTLSRGNKGWAGDAAALAIGVAQSVNAEGEPMPYGEYGLGLAAQNLVLQAVAEGLHAHQMAGFDREAARVEFAIPDDFEPLVAIAIGDLGSLDGMPERLVEKELRPRIRKPLTDLVFTESWGTPLF